MITEALILKVGTSIAKVLVKIWLKDSPIANEVGIGLVDLIKSKTDNVVAARKGARVFEDIGDRVALSLEKVYEIYGDDEISHEAVAHEASKAIDNANIDSELLAKLNNSPVQLKNYILDQYEAKNLHFSEAEESLFHRSIDLSAQYVIDISPQLPNYSSRNLAEILLRLDDNKDSLEKILEILDEIQETSHGVSRNRDAYEFESDYRASVNRKFDKLELLGVDLQKANKRYNLSISYISLDVTSGYDEGNIESADYDRLSAIDALARSSSINNNLDSNVIRVAITGEAGTGKTTLLKWLATKASQNKLGKKLIDLHNSVPFFIELRQFDDDFPPPEKIVAHKFPEIANQMPDLWVEDILKSGRGLLLIDGLDEVKPNNRQKVIEWLEGLIYSYPKTSIVFTSRSAAYELNMLSYLQFEEYQLLPMRPRDIELFVSYWHKAVLIEGGLESPHISNFYARKLVSQIRGGSSLLKLASNPLLCAMICALHYDREMQLPNQKNELYEACCYMLVERRDKERAVQSNNQLNYKQKRIILDDLAYWMIKNGYTRVSLDRAVGRILSKLERMLPDETDFETDEMTKSLVERSGVLRLPTVDSVDFIHKSFQEFMAANAVVLEDDWGVLIQNVDDDQWKEVIILAAADANEEQANALITEILAVAEQHIDNIKQYSYLNLLAISCMDASILISPGLRKTVEHRIREFIPPQDSSQKASLIYAGDLAVPYLSFDESKDQHENLLSIDILEQIGTKNAINQLKTFLIADDLKVHHAIENATISLDQQEVIDSGLPLSLLGKLSERVVDNSLAIDGGLLFLISKEDISTVESQFPTSISTLAVSNFEFIHHGLHTFAPKLKRLTLTGNTLPSVEYLFGLNHLEELALVNDSPYWPSIASIEKIGGLKKLILVTPSFEWPNLRYLAECTELSDLTLVAEFEGELPGIDDLGHLPNLCRLEMVAMNGIVPEVSQLVKFDNLEELVLSIPVPVGINVLSDLTHLDIENIKINTEQTDTMLSNMVSELISFGGVNLQVDGHWEYDRRDYFAN